MARFLCVLVLFTVIGACAFAGLAKPRTVPIPAAGKHAVRRSGSDNWPYVRELLTIPGEDYPEVISTLGGVYEDSANGYYTAEGTYNDRPVYKNGDWSIYYRVSGYAANHWVLDFNEVSEDWDGTVAYNSELILNNNII